MAEPTCVAAGFVETEEEAPDGKMQYYEQTGAWFASESNNIEQEQLAQDNFNAICEAVDEFRKAGRCPSGRWTNDPEVFPDLSVLGTQTSSQVVPFPPHDQQYYIRGKHHLESSKLRYTSIPDFRLDSGNSTWTRLADYSDFSDAASLFEPLHSKKTHLGRIHQGALDNGYFIEALQAVSLRPRLAKQLFYCSDVKRSVYVARIHKHGTWVRLELDDYVPAGPQVGGENKINPICCRSEFFPYVLWPSLVEKAYAKLHTLRMQTSGCAPEDRGGWEAIGGGGTTEEALADLTGGVAGRFYTKDVAADRLFIYMYELQNDSLFICRPNVAACEMYGVHLNPYYPNVVNRAATFEGQLFVQVFCSAPGVFDGGLQDAGVPWGLLHCRDYPETVAEGFFWITAVDFHAYYDTVIECRLTNSGDVSIAGMPQPRIPACPRPLQPDARALGGGPSTPWYEWVFASLRERTHNNPPRFSIFVPESEAPCEIVASIEQQDTRMNMARPGRQKQAAILVRAYEKIGNKFNAEPFFHSEPLCSSNWLPIRDAMVAFTATESKEFRLTVEFPDTVSRVDRMLFRCYSTRRNIQVRAWTAQSMSPTHFVERFNVAQSNNPPTAQVLSLVGSSMPCEPEGFGEEGEDSMRKPQHDLGGDMAEELKHDCSLM